MVQKRQGKEETTLKSRKIVPDVLRISSGGGSSSSSSNNKISTPNSVASSAPSGGSSLDRPPLPSQEELRLLTEGRSPFHCLSCDKRLSKSSLRSHLKNKHPGVVDSLNFACLICSESLSSLGALNTHTHSELYPCFKCEAKKKDPASFPDFDRLKSHLFNAHNRTQWPWSCSFCDSISFFELDYIVHLRSHSSQEITNFSCPECHLVAANHSDLRQHLIQAHLPQSKTTKMANDENAVNHEIATLLLNLASRTTQAPPTNRATVAVVAHQQQSSLHAQSNFDKPEDLSKGPQQQAMDLSSKRAPLLKLPPTIDTAKLKNMTITPVTTIASSSIPNGSGVLETCNNNNTGVSSSSSATASSNSSSSSSLNSNYLLQNLLLGKMATQHQLIVPGGPAIMIPNSSSSSTAQHLPKYALKNNNSLHGTKESIISIPSSTGINPVLTQNHNNSPVNNNINNNSSGSIPLLCGQIVAQLNGLLFLVHDLNSPTLENSLQASLGSIYGRLQEIVSLVEQTKTKIDGSSEDLLKHNEIQKQIKESKQKEEEKIAKHIQEYQRALLQQQTTSATSSSCNTATLFSKCPPSPLPSQILPSLKETLPVAAANSVVTMLKKQGLEATIKFDGVPLNYGVPSNGSDHILHLPHSETTVSSSPTSSSSEHMEVESSTGSNGRRRRGRPPKNSSSSAITTEGPLEKKFRESPPSLTLKNSHQCIPIPTPVTSPPTVSNNNNGVSAKGSKGIRNRVFCGECPGCLKNDDCGRCRYCQDKTKFGGQNRLRQKCLHRRCQMDTHRKRASNSANNNSNASSSSSSSTNITPGTTGNTMSNTNSVNTSNSNTISPAPVLPIVTLSMEEAPSKLLNIPGNESAPATIYSGVDLAKIKENNVSNKKPPMEDRVTITNSKTKEEVEIKAILEDANSTNKPVVVSIEQSDSSKATIGETHVPPVEGVSSSKEVDSDEESSKAAQVASRLDKWKMKHEAMLKKGVETTEEGHDDGDKKEEDITEEDPPPSGGNDDSSSKTSEGSLCIDFDAAHQKKTPSNPPPNQAVLSV